MSVEQSAALYLVVVIAMGTVAATHWWIQFQQWLADRAAPDCEVVP